MKSIDLLCASPASTAICSSTDQRAMVRHGTRPIDHHRRRTHQISDRKKPKNIPIIPCSSQPPINPKPYYQKSRKSASASASASAAKQISDRQVIRRKSTSADINDLTSSATPHGSSRYLLSDKPFIDLLSETDNLSALVVSQPVMPRSLSSNDSLIISDNSKLAASQSLRPHRQLIRSNESLVLKSSSTRSQARYQVVELMVSIHCKGCEGKVRKHISRMEGVTSFSIDRETKKVIVIGNVTPLGVLSSISRVKNAQFWPSPTSSSSSST